MKKDIANQSGRSMLELILVLMIVSLMMTAGIIAMPLMLAKYREQKILEDMLIIANEIRVKYSNTGDYTGLNNQTLIDNELVEPNQIGENGASILLSSKVELSVAPVSNVIPKNSAFELTIRNLSNNECVYIGKQDYYSTLSEVTKIGLGKNSGLTYFTHDKPLISEVYALCDCDDDVSAANCSVALTFI